MKQNEKKKKKSDNLNYKAGFKSLFIETPLCARHQDLRHVISMSEIVLFTYGRHLVLHARINYL